MRNFSIFLKICIIFGLLIIFYYIIITNNTIRKEIQKFTTGKVLLVNQHENDYNIWLIFTKVNNRSPLTYKFINLIENLLNVSSVPLKFNIIIDDNSKSIVEKIFADIVLVKRKIEYSYYHVEECAFKIRDIVSALTPHFSSRPGTYYSGALFYISLGLYRIAPDNQNKAILLDCDLYFKQDVALLFKEFDRFKPTALFGLAPELTPVYRHILHQYKSKHNITFGEYYHENNIFHSSSVHPKGFQGYNSGVVLINLKALREDANGSFAHVISNATIDGITSKYNFRGHLGDQDFYTLIGFEYPDLIQTLHCGFNRQLCTWWRDHGYSDVFHYYFKCNHSVVVLHGNCNTRMPK